MIHIIRPYGSSGSYSNRTFIKVEEEKKSQKIFISIGDINNFDQATNIILDYNDVSDLINLLELYRSKQDDPAIINK